MKNERASKFLSNRLVIQRSRPMTYVRGGAQYLRQILLRAGYGFGDIAALRQQGRDRRRERTACPARLARRDLGRSKNVEFASVEKDISGFVFHVPAFDQHRAPRRSPRFLRGA